MPSPDNSTTESVPLKSKRVATSRAAWSTALRTSCWSISDTTSKEDMAGTLPVLHGHAPAGPALPAAILRVSRVGARVAKGNGL